MNKEYIGSSFRYWSRVFFKYRANVVFSFFSELALPIAINALFMVGVGDSVVTPPQMVNVIAYVILANIIFSISMTDIENTISSDIKSAKLTYKLLAPVSPWLDYLVADIATKAIRIVLFYCPCALLLMLFGSFTAMNLLPVFLSLLIAATIGYCISFLIGCLSFWITEIWGVSAMKSLLLSVFAGAIFPLTILPSGIRNILMLTPFPYVSYVPAALMMGDSIAIDLPHALFTGAIWCVLLVLSLMLQWKQGLKKYESVGV